MPRIEFVNLSLNRLETPLVEPPPCPMTNLRSLVLNNTKLNWYSVEELLKLLPSLEELHLSLNEYTHVLLDTIEDDDQGNNNCKPSPIPSDDCNCDDETPTSLGSEGELLLSLIARANR
jgi:tubulin-specific chaperone cofactor E-like protein